MLTVEITRSDLFELIHRAVSSAVGEGWLDKKGLAAHLSCSTRSIEYAMDEGLPHTIIFGRPKFKASVVESWLEAHGHLERCDEPEGEGRLPSTTRPRRAA